MPTFLQPVDVPDRCFLHDALLWVAFQRLPTAWYNDSYREIREATEHEGYAIESPEGPLTEDECNRVGIPVDPERSFLLDERPSPLTTYNELEAKYGPDEADRRIREEMNRNDQEHERACSEWQPHYQRAIEYPASQLFVALKSGQLRASGRLLPSVEYEKAMKALETEGRYVGDLPLKEIPSSFWSLKGIHFESSAAENDTEHYCHIVLRTADVLALFPGERQEVIVERVGDLLLLNEQTKNRPRSLRGRPPYPWDSFHLEIAAAIQRDELPAKKEAAIQHFQSWFERELGLRPSRAAVGEKLTPYYEKFVRRGRQKTG